MWRKRPDTKANQASLQIAAALHSNRAYIIQLLKVWRLQHDGMPGTSEEH